MIQVCLFSHSLTASTVEGNQFKISRTDGIISVASPLDREAIGDTVTLTVKVQVVFCSSTKHQFPPSFFL